LQEYSLIMKKRTSPHKLIKTVTCLFIAFGLLVYAEDKLTVMEDFSLPLEYDEANNIKSQLFGQKAIFTPGKPVDISEFKLEFYKKGKLEMSVKSPQCDYDQATGTANSESKVRIDRKADGLTITGKGFSWDAKGEKFTIFKNTRVTLKNMGKQKINPAEKEKEKEKEEDSSNTGETLNES